MKSRKGSFRQQEDPLRLPDLQLKNVNDYQQMNPKKQTNQIEYDKDMPNVDIFINEDNRNKKNQNQLPQIEANTKNTNLDLMSFTSNRKYSIHSKKDSKLQIFSQRSEKFQKSIINESNDKSYDIKNNNDENQQSESFSEASRLKEKGFQIDEDANFDQNGSEVNTPQSIKRKAKEDGQISEFSGVLNTVTEDDIKYKDVEINTKIIKEKFKFHIERSMQGITGFDIDKIINQTYDGFLLNLNRERETQANDQRAVQIIKEQLQPKIVKKIKNEDQQKKYKIEIVEGKKLKQFNQVEFQKGQGVQVFFEGIFQTLQDNGVIKEPGKLVNLNPAVDNLSLKQLALNQQINQKDWEKFEEIFNGIVREKNIGLKDAVDEAVKREIENYDDDGPQEQEFNKLIEDIWENFKQEINQKNNYSSNKIKEMVNQKLQEYLKENSEYLSGSVQRYLESVDKGQKIEVDDRISNLGLLTFERKEFMKNLESIRQAFVVEIRAVKIKSASRAKDLILRLFQDFKKLFYGEYQLIVEQYNQMRFQLYKNEKQIEKNKEKLVFLEQLNYNKDLFYENLPIRFIEMVEDFNYAEPSQINLSQQDISNANVLLNQVFEFYGGYAQLSANAKDQVGESMILAQFIHKIQMLTEEVQKKDALLEAANRVSDIVISSGENDMQTIYDLQDSVKRLEAQIEADNQRHLEVKRKLYDDFIKENKKIKKQFKKFKSLAELEIKIKDQIVEKSVKELEAIKLELKTLKTVLEQPKLRAELNKYQVNDLDYQKFLRTINDLSFDVKKQMIQKKIIKQSEDFKKEKFERSQLFQMNQTFNMTYTSFMNNEAQTSNNPAITPLMNQTGFTFNGQNDVESKGTQIPDELIKLHNHAYQQQIGPGQTSKGKDKKSLGMRSTHQTLENTQYNSTARVFGNKKNTFHQVSNDLSGPTSIQQESRNIFGSTLIHGMSSQADSDFKKQMLTKTMIRLNNNSDLSNNFKFKVSNIQKESQQVLGQSNNAQNFKKKVSQNFFRASSIGAIYNFDPNFTVSSEQIANQDVQNNSNKNIDQHEQNNFNQLNINSSQILPFPHSIIQNDTNLSKRSFVDINGNKRSFISIENNINQAGNFQKKSPKAHSQLPKMSDELKKNLNKHFGLNINSINSRQNISIGGENQQILLSNQNKGSRIDSTQNSHHNLGFTIGGQLQSNFQNQSGLIPNNFQNQFQQIMNNEGIFKGNTLIKTQSNSGSKQNINIQSGASLAMRGHFPHNQGGLILEGKFMDVGLKNQRNSLLKKNAMGNMDLIRIGEIDEKLIFQSDANTLQNVRSSIQTLDQNVNSKSLLNESSVQSQDKDLMLKSQIQNDSVQNLEIQKSVKKVSQNPFQKEIKQILTEVKPKHLNIEFGMFEKQKD